MKTKRDQLLYSVSVSHIHPHQFIFYYVVPNMPNIKRGLPLTSKRMIITSPPKRDIGSGRVLQSDGDMAEINVQRIKINHPGCSIPVSLPSSIIVKIEPPPHLSPHRIYLQWRIPKTPPYTVDESACYSNT